MIVCRNGGDGIIIVRGQTETQRLIFSNVERISVRVGNSVHFDVGELSVLLDVELQRIGKPDFRAKSPDIRGVGIFHISYDTAALTPQPLYGTSLRLVLVVFDSDRRGKRR